MGLGTTLASAGARPPHYTGKTWKILIFSILRITSKSKATKSHHKYILFNQPTFHKAQFFTRLYSCSPPVWPCLPLATAGPGGPGPGATAQAPDESAGTEAADQATSSRTFTDIGEIQETFLDSWLLDCCCFDVTSEDIVASELNAFLAFPRRTRGE